MEVDTIRPGDPVPDFCLPTLDGITCCLHDFRGQIVVLLFWSAECPVSRQYDAYFTQHYEAWQKQGIVLLAIDSNANYGWERICEEARTRGVPFLILRDEDNVVADMLGALTTPHVFVVDRKGRLAYAGAVDDRTFRKRVAERNYLEEALVAVLAGRKPDPALTSPYGCTIVRVAKA